MNDKSFARALLLVGGMVVAAWAEYVHLASPGAFIIFAILGAMFL